MNLERDRFRNEKEKKKSINDSSRKGKKILTDLDFFFSLCFHLIGIYYLVKDF